MKKYFFGIFVLALWLGNMNCVRVKAYSVTVEKSGMYAEVVPDTFLDNAAALFKRNVKKTMMYYNKYKDLNPVDYADKMSSVSGVYVDFVDVAKQIKPTDEIVIRAPFYIYDMWDRTKGDGPYIYYFTAERNGKELCLFQIYADPYDQKVAFSYDKLMNQYFSKDKKNMEDAIYYKIGDVTYAETPVKICEVRNQATRSENAIMEGGPDLEEAAREFNKKNYSQKKEEIFSYLGKIKKDGIPKKMERKLKIELEDDYVAPKRNVKQNRIGRKFYILAGGIVMILAVAGILAMKRQKQE